MNTEKFNILMSKYGSTLKETSKTTDTPPNYMTDCNHRTVNFDKYKEGYCKPLGLAFAPMSCDALFLSSTNEFYLIEFKCGGIEVKKNSEIKMKILESLLLLLNEFEMTIEDSRAKLNFILVYNESEPHGEKQLNDCYYSISDAVSKLANKRVINFGLGRYEGMYFKKVFTYNRSEFRTEFTDKSFPAI